MVGYKVAILALKTKSWSHNNYKNIIEGFSMNNKGRNGSILVKKMSYTHNETISSSNQRTNSSI